MSIERVVIVGSGGLFGALDGRPEDERARLLVQNQKNLGEAVTKQTVDSTLAPGLKKLGVDTGTTAILAISGSDTTQAQGQLDSFIERWKSEGVDENNTSSACWHPARRPQVDSAQKEDVPHPARSLCGELRIKRASGGGTVGTWDQRAQR